MAARAALALGAFCTSLATVYAQSSSTSTPDATTSYRAIFTVPAAADASVPLIPNIYDSEAVNAQDVCPGYLASNVVRTMYGLTASLNLAGPACNTYGTDIENLNLTVEYQSDDRLHVEIVPTYVGDSNSSWYILPDVLVQKPTIDADANTTLDSDLNFVWSNDPTFSFQIIRQSTGDVLFDTTGTKLVYENQFIEFASALPENYNLYGLGEVIHGLRMGNNFTRTFWAADVGDPIDYNIYGDHSFYLDTRYYEINETTGNLTYAPNATDATGNYVSYSHGVYMRNSHGQEVLMRPSNITWRTLGGSIDLYFYAGPSQKEVTKAYQESATGLPAMQQYFTFGYHQCRWGYTNWSELQDVVDSFKKFGIPLENIWTDIDYMNQYRDFDNDQGRFGYVEGAKFLSQLHENGQHYIPIVDSAIYVPNPENASDAYPIFNRGNESDAFMLNPDGSLYIGEVWPGYTVFPDWIGAVLNGTGAFDWWSSEMTMWHQNISFDGIWIDMSEVSSFCVGSCGSNNLTLNPVHPGFGLPGEPGNIIYGYPEGFNITNATEYASAQAGSSSQASAAAATAAPAPTTSTTYIRTTPTPGARAIEYPPYVINNVQGALDVHAVSPNATHHGGTQEYDYHNLFGTQILNATYHALLNVFPGKRPFIIGRSTFAGSGKWSGHWGGDNTSLFAYMYFSISQALSFSLFGIPMFGVDTCGFNGNTDEELCNRWMQLSAFFPFYRNHNTLSAISQEPYRWASVAEASKTAMNIRYTLLPYIYTTFYLAHSTGSTVMRALAWEFPNDPTLAAVDTQFMFGDSLLITPVLAQGATTVNGVFPGVGSGEVWYDWYNQSAVTAGPGENITIDAPLGHIPVYVRGGSVLPIQEPGYTTKESRSNPWGLLAACSMEGTASGQLYIDDGESVVQNSTLWVEFSLTKSALYASARGLFQDTNPLANITIIGVQSAVNNVTLNGATIASGWTYNATSKVLAIEGLMNSTSAGAWVSDWVLRWM
ncbi:glycoside hydrolase family 31 protein [Mollisia scopiformis]|uniref:alpha-glucosidase n=1 Tax=Mollisia scopiformis TaxID=149040 RepID=A0A132B5F6_MOLSC|nr:glycoside hydrolase family 31 protein [Mollisia scopiformis]KUJ07646.1 glycoside hydrolase family 31 protein [Mollisia scopiformis]